jgi:hypothetical protein
VSRIHRRGGITRAGTRRVDMVHAPLGWHASAQRPSGSLASPCPLHLQATHPYMTAPGNHESDDDTFTQYRTRFYNLHAAAKKAGSNSTL